MTIALTDSSTNHPCKAGSGGTPCNRFRRGEAYDISKDCRICWLAAHDPRYALAWTGSSKVTPAPSAPVNVPSTAPRPMLLGDTIESALSRVGVTKEQVEKWIGGPCGCTERQRRLNELHQWAQKVASDTVAAARGWLSKLIGEQNGPAR